MKRKSLIIFCFLAGFVSGAYTVFSASTLSVQIPKYDIAFFPTPNPGPDPTPLLSISENLFPFDNRSWKKFHHRDLIAKTAKKYELDPQLIYATIMTESEGEEYAYRWEQHLKEPSLCMGQILISTARSLGFRGAPSEIFQPSTCIDLVGKYHSVMLKTFGKLTPVQLAVAYNAGSPWKRAVWGHVARFRKWFEGGTV